MSDDDGECCRDEPNYENEDIEFAFCWSNDESSKQQLAKRQKSSASLSTVATLESFQTADQEYLQSMQSAYRDSIDSHQCQQETRMRSVINSSHFDQVFKRRLPMQFEDFCCVLLNCISRPCGACMLRIQRSALHDQEFSVHETYAARWLSAACPHLVSSEWHGLLRLRAIGKQFWREFIRSTVGKSIVLYEPKCVSCDWANMFFGASLKNCPMDRVLLERLNKSPMRERVAQVCGLSSKRLVDGPCNCRRTG